MEFRLAHELPKRDDGAAVRGGKVFSLLFGRERQSPWRTAVVRHRSSFLHLVHVHPVVLARQYAASLDEPCRIRRHCLPCAVIMNGDQAHGLALLISLGNRTARTADFCPL